MEFEFRVWKTLSRNDTGETKSHQSGISIPKEIASSGIFPILDAKQLNPRTEVFFFDENNNRYSFQFIYYNDIFFREDKKRGHNEYRLTRVKEFVIPNGIKAGDKIWFAIDRNGVRKIGFEKAQNINQNEENKESENETIIVLKGGWKCVKY